MEGSRVLDFSHGGIEVTSVTIGALTKALASQRKSHQFLPHPMPNTVLTAKLWWKFHYGSRSLFLVVCLFVFWDGGGDGVWGDTSVNVDRNQKGAVVYMAKLISRLISDFSKEDFTLGSSFWAFQLLFLKFLSVPVPFFFWCFLYKEIHCIDGDELLECLMLGRPWKFLTTKVQEFTGQVTQALPTAREHTRLKREPGFRPRVPCFWYS